MSEKIPKNLWKKSMTKKQWQLFSAMTDKDIDTSDIPELDANFWKNARIVKPVPKRSESSFSG